MKKLLLALSIALPILSCSSKDSILALAVMETAGIDRDLEYLEIQWQSKIEPKNNDTFSISGEDGVFEGQILNVEKPRDGEFKITAIFPVSIEANETKNYSVITRPSELKSDLKVKGSDLNLEIENDFFTADLTANKLNPEAPLAPGQVRSLTLKNYGNQLLKRNKINIHWSPNFQGPEREYRTLSHLMHPEVGQSEIGPYKITIHKEGKIDDYPEIRLKSTYEFYAGFPYFIFSSEILMEEHIELYLLRNDEMTMDSLFTHVIYRDRAKGVIEKPLYAKSTFEELDEEPIRDNTAWLFFCNKDLHYGYKSIRLEYDNKNLSGTQSPLYKPHSKITAVGDGGRYWNRRLIHEKDTFVPKGSKYIERNVYFNLDVGSDPEKEIDSLYQKIYSPLRVAYQ